MSSSVTATFVFTKRQRKEVMLYRHGGSRGERSPAKSGLEIGRA